MVEGPLGYILEEAGASREEEDTKSFVDVHLRILECSQDKIVQMIEESLVGAAVLTCSQMKASAPGKGDSWELKFASALSDADRKELEGEREMEERPNGCWYRSLKLFVSSALRGEIMAYGTWD
ncbi:UNVERIFIED_CONTAM: hypothetical protein K2H54_014192 [Gekko kuhli]